MRLVGRYFGIGATLGSVTGLLTLVLVWGWMTIRLGVLGFLLGWIPAGLAAAALWLAMVVFWGPILVVGTMIALVLALISQGRHRAWDRTWDAPPEASAPGEAAASSQTDAQRDAAPAHDTATPPPAEAPIAPPAPLEIPAPNPSSAAASAPFSAPAPAPPRGRSPEDLGGDAAAAGDTSRKRPQ